MKFLQLFHTRLSGALLLLLGLAWIWFSAVPTSYSTNENIPAPQTGFLAPEISLKTLENQPIRLSDLRGRVVLINFWASWCPPCKAEMPAIENVYQAYKDQGFSVLAVDSTVQDTLANAQAFVIEKHLTFPILVDDTGLATRLYQISSLPTSFLVDRNGIIREIIIGGPMAEATLTIRVQNLLNGAY